MVDKDKVKSLISKLPLVGFFMIIVPIVGFLAINLFTPLEPLLYVISSLSGFYIICFLVMIELWKGLESKLQKGICFLIFVLVLPVVFFFFIDILIPINLTAQHYGEAGFSYFFSIGVTAGYEILISKDK
jgi:hypothetical protein